MPSTALADIAYDPEAQTLDVTFIASGRRYRYFGVSLDEYDALRHAPSKGAHFNRRLKPLHDYALLFGAPPAGPISATIAKSNRSA